MLESGQCLKTTDPSYPENAAFVAFVTAENGEGPGLSPLPSDPAPTTRGKGGAAPPAFSPSKAAAAGRRPTSRSAASTRSSRGTATRQPLRWRLMERPGRTLERRRDQLVGRCRAKTVGARIDPALHSEIHSLVRAGLDIASTY